MADQIIEPARTRQPWDRRPDESKRAFDAFVLYRDSPDRRLANVAKALVPPCSTANIGRWVSRHQWQSRASDWDCYVDEQDRSEIARQRVSGRKRRLAIAHALEGLSAHAIREWQTRLAAGLPLNMSLESAALLSKTAAQLEEQALGPEKDRRYTKIVVTIGEYPTEQAYENELRRNDPPAASSYDTFPDETLNADARGDIVDDDPQARSSSHHAHA
jgi:hypothetical protein